MNHNLQVTLIKKSKLSSVLYFSIQPHSILPYKQPLNPSRLPIIQRKTASHRPACKARVINTAYPVLDEYGISGQTPKPSAILTSHGTSPAMRKFYYSFEMIICSAHTNKSRVGDALIARTYLPSCADFHTPEAVHPTSCSH